MTPEEQTAYDLIEGRCNHAADQIYTKMVHGSREYPELRALVEAYINYRTAADRISHQTDSSFGEFDGIPMQ